MFGISGSEFLFIVVVALVVLGPRDLPRAMLQLGRAVRLMRRKVHDLQTEADQLLRDLELSEVKSELEKTARQMQAVAADEVLPAVAPLSREVEQVQTAVEQAGGSIQGARDDARMEAALGPAPSQQAEPRGAGKERFPG